MAILYSKEVKMTSLLEKIIENIAPHTCKVCSKEYNIVCNACLETEWLPLAPCCVLCGGNSLDWRTCDACADSPYTAIWATTAYEGLAKELIHAFKFGRARAAAKVLASSLDATLPYLADVVVVPVPTAASHIRQRGYDHAHLLAKELARMRHLPLVSALERRSSSRQVGAGRDRRYLQVVDAFAVANPSGINGRKVLAVDDVCTSGATLRAVAVQIATCTTESIFGAVVARKI